MNGDASKLPGGGPALAMKTVEQVIGVPVQYYAQIEFAYFVRLIDELDKIPVYVEKKIFIDPMGPGADEIMLTKGLHMLGGVEALAYARNRHTQGGDVDRAKRQQQVILGIRERVLEPDNFPRLIARAPEIYAIIQDGVHTNLTFDQMMRLAMLAKDIPLESIEKGIINYDMVTLQDVTVDGVNQSVFKPIPDKIRELRDEIFTATGAVSPLAQGADALDLAKQEGATIAIYNGTYTDGLAGKTSDYLKSLGFNVVITESATTFPAATVVKDHRGKPYALKYFKELFRLNGAIQIQSDFDPAATADIEIILGPDWAAGNPMP
jgi:LCP family protein required for cell wall assembly